MRGGWSGSTGLNVLYIYMIHVILCAQVEGLCDTGATHLALMLYTCSVNATGSKKLGVSIDPENKSYLTIKAVAKGGLLEAWNQDHPERKIRVLDEIVAVNGKVGDALSMIDELVLPQVLTITLRRCEEYNIPEERLQAAPQTPPVGPRTPPGRAPHTPLGPSPHTPQD